LLKASALAQVTKHPLMDLFSVKAQKASAKSTLQELLPFLWQKEVI